MSNVKFNKGWRTKIFGSVDSNAVSNYSRVKSSQSDKKYGAFVSLCVLKRKSANFFEHK